jgi:hypothetical protein
MKQPQKTPVNQANIKTQSMKKILILLASLLCLTHNTQAQTTEQYRMAYYFAHKDSIASTYIRLMFQAKNEDGEMLETFAKRRLGKKYDELVNLTKDEKLDYDKAEKLIKSVKFIRLILGVNKQFFKDKRFRKSFARTWNNSHAVINELVCTKKEYKYMVEHTLADSKLYFTLIVFPFLLESFQVDW